MKNFEFILRKYFPQVKNDAPKKRLPKSLSLALIRHAYSPTADHRKKVVSLLRQELVPRIKGDHPKLFRKQAQLANTARQMNCWRWAGEPKKKKEKDKVIFKTMNSFRRMVSIYKQSIEPAGQSSPALRKTHETTKITTTPNFNDGSESCDKKQPQVLTIQLECYRELRQRLLSAQPGQEKRYQQDLIKQANRVLALRTACPDFSRPFLPNCLIGFPPHNEPLKVCHAEAYTLFENYLIDKKQFDPSMLSKAQLEEDSLRAAARLICEASFSSLMRLFQNSFVSESGLYTLWLYLRGGWQNVTVEACDTKVEGEIWPSLLESALQAEQITFKLPDLLTSLLGCRLGRIDCSSHIATEQITHSIKSRYSVVTQKPPYLRLSSIKQVQTQSKEMMTYVLTQDLQQGSEGWRSLEELSSKYVTLLVIQNIPGYYRYQTNLYSSYHNEELELDIDDSMHMFFHLQPLSSVPKPAPLKVTLFEQTRPFFWVHVASATFRGRHTLDACLEHGLYKLTIEGGNTPYELNIQGDKPFKEPTLDNKKDRRLMKGLLVSAKGRNS